VLHVTQVEIHDMAIALRETAEVMVKAGSIGPVEAVTRSATEALLDTVKKWKSDNAVIAAMTVQPSTTWPEVLTIANTIYQLTR
jgi:hypothetical protein